MREAKMHWPRRFMRHVTGASLGILLAVPMGLQAGDHWLSRVTVKTPSQPDMIMPASQAAAGGLVSVMRVDSKAVFDITISLDSNPQGDAEKSDYEERIKEFGRAVYQSTNGAHKIGRVTIFREGAQRNRVDVIWDENCPDSAERPRAHPSGFGVVGRHIWMCTNFTWPIEQDTREEEIAALLPTPKGSGYVLAHEWGHYAYGLYDEYNADCRDKSGLIAKPLFESACQRSKPRSSDTPSVPSIMNDPWRAAEGEVDFLEFSTPNIEPFRSDSTETTAGSTPSMLLQNAQKRVFGESAWETLTRDPATDPKYRWLPTRTQYTTLTAPTAPNWIVNDDELPEDDEPNIRWVGNAVADLSIDVSGSMSGTPLANAKTGANLLIDQLQAGEALGVSSFASGTTRNFAITDIPDPDTGVRADAKAAVNALRAGGWTAMYDGLMLSLNDTQAFDPNRPAVVYLLSDGADNRSSATQAGVIEAYQAAQVPIIALAYGSFAPTGDLLKLANATGGAFSSSPTTLPEVQQALLTAQAQFSDTRLLSSTRTSIAPGTTIRTLPLDSTLASVLINLSYSGAGSELTFTLLRPDGSDTGAPFVCEGATSCSVTLDNDFFTANGYGDYQVRMVNSTNIPRDVTILASGNPAGASYDIAVGFSSDTITYPADMAIAATVAKGSTIAGLDVMAMVTDPLGNVFDLALLDDGNGADLVADDGVYSASVPYAVDGSYSVIVTASNADGKARTTLEGVIAAPTGDGSPLPSFEPTPITENFVRVGSASATAAGVMRDDHDDDPAGGACTQILADNADTVGRIDFAGDRDCFAFVPTQSGDSTIVRVTSLAAGMDPRLIVYNHTGSRAIAEADMATSGIPDSGLVAAVPSDVLDPDGVVFVVEHIDPLAATGNYAVSAGVPLTSDQPDDPANETSDRKSSSGCSVAKGGALDPLLPLLFLAALAGLFLRKRRHNA